MRRVCTRVRSAAEEATLRKSQSFRSYQGIAALSAALMVPALAACSSSSSPAEKQAKAAASAESRASSIASRLGVTPIPSLAPGGHGPNGDITAPATNAPSKTSPGGSVVFPNVDSKQARTLVARLSKFKFVRSAPYYPQFDQLQVYFDKGATAADRDKVHTYVVRHVPDAAGTTTSASPTASAS